MSKKEVKENRLVDCVLHDDDSLLTFDAWWKTIDEDETVEVQNPHHRLVEDH